MHEHLLYHSYSLFCWSSKGRAKKQEMHEHLLFHSYLLCSGRPAWSATGSNKCTNTWYFTAVSWLLVSQQKALHTCTTTSHLQLFVGCRSSCKGRDRKQYMYEHLLFHSYSLFWGRPTRSATKNNKCTNTWYGYFVICCWFAGRGRNSENETHPSR